MLYKALLLDLDGTVRYSLGEKPYPKKPEEVAIFDDAMPRIRNYKAMDFLVLGISNQAGIGYGEMSSELCSMVMHKTNELMGFVFDDIIYCPHRPEEGCACRKPSPGMIYALAHRHNLDLGECIMVGDMESDKACALAAGVTFLPAKRFFKREDVLWKT